MSKKEVRDLNVTINSKENDDDSVVISMSGLGKGLKKYFLPWIIIAAILAVCVTGMNTIKVVRQKTPLTALVSFNYNGIEKGLDPAGHTFDINSIKNVQVISDALTEHDLDLVYSDKIRNAMSFEGIIPSDAIDKMTTYQSVYQSSQNGNLAAAQAMLDVTYYPTQFKVTFEYGRTGLSRKDAVQVLNSILDGYRSWFFEQYGYNQSMGAAMSAISYEDYDYAEAVDLFRVNINTISSYVDTLSRTDTSHFRSMDTGNLEDAGLTGYTFEDISQALDATKKIDLARISSYVTVNNVTKDKEATIAYYQYNIDELNRDKNAYAERLDNLKKAIDSYQKDTVMVMAALDSANNATMTQGSEEYDKLVERYDNVATQLANVKQEIAMYTQFRDNLSGNKSCTEAMENKTKEDLAKLNTKLEKYINITRIASEQYYETVEFSNAYSVLVPALDNKMDGVKAIMNKSIMPIALTVGLSLVVYVAVAFVFAIRLENGKKKKVTAGAKDDDDDADDDFDDDDDSDAEVESDKADKKDNDEKSGKDKKSKK